jgi:hypothetical protein
MFPNEAIDAFGKYWRRRKPWKGTVLHYASDLRIFFRRAQGYGVGCAWARSHSYNPPTCWSVNAFPDRCYFSGGIPGGSTCHQITQNIFEPPRVSLHNHRNPIAIGQLLPQSLDLDHLPLIATYFCIPHDRGWHGSDFGTITFGIPASIRHALVTIASVTVFATVFHEVCPL